MIYLSGRVAGWDAGAGGVRGVVSKLSIAQLSNILNTRLLYYAFKYMIGELSLKVCHFRPVFGVLCKPYGGFAPELS